MTPTSTFKIFFCSLFLITAGLFARGATNGVGVTMVSYSLDTNLVSLGYTITISAEVTNYDSTQFSGTINFGLRNGNDTLTNAGVFGQPPYSGDNITIGGNQTVPAIFTVYVTTPYFVVGPNVIVVWPICTRPVADTILLPINVIDPPSGINQLNNLPLSWTVVNNNILLKTTDPTINFKQVRIYDVIGQKLVSINSSNITQIRLPQLPHGIYLCELVTTDGRRATFKFAAPGE